MPEKTTDMGERRVCGDGDTVQRYVDILSDAGFKAVFGDQKNKDVLMDLLNVRSSPGSLPRGRASGWTSGAQGRTERVS